MGTQGSFGYKIGRKIRLMHIQIDADLLWQICVREIYILMKHYQSIDLVKEAFENLKEAKGKPKSDFTEKCKCYTDSNINQTQSEEDWYSILRFCQHSFINILDSGYFLNNGTKSGLIFLLDFNTNSVRFYSIDLEKKETEHQLATIDEIMGFEDMPTKSYTEILTEMKERYKIFSKNLENINKKLDNIQTVINKTKELGGEQNIIEKAKKLLDDANWEKKKIEMDYRFFYHRLDALNLIDHNNQ
jgi:hypothetical protein